MVVRNMSKDLFKGTFKHGGTSRKISIRLENFFRNNKEARAIQLDHKFRTTEIGDLSIHAYYQELKSILDLLANVDAPITERTLVTYLLNGLNGKYDNIINVIMHRQPFPTFEEARSMLILEEDRLGKGKKTLSTNDASSSSAKVLIATVSNSDSKSGHQQQQPARFNQNRGNRGRCDNRGRGLLGARPQQHHGAFGNAANQKQKPTMDFASAFNTLTLMDPSDNQWYMDSGATAHLSNTTGSNDQEDNSPQ
ncbi:PREDICTED: uncharacterized protein LOC106303010 [Brassica oleracea var. oleracea]|uniref:uncharacterized protein LOC106303010 n=1 Tax=Brassica oleracea var. oleracea TaxID=109376 RepID=UPI0006A6B92C|nr:PREDICTED: uncharacterized protein LOC106303010 [Brassica oleracea var. oleracea]